ncbi:MAG TPA: hypothetical protein PKX38_03550 [Alphaproteobacteria bacterium]|nr:hypothetical protein [Micavibrio sp.]MBK9563115.1 hypothetical protein [Micavibrio sp.]HQX26995.1 hypothetical protein [Alphaproteobacteria bacterium]
MKKLIFFISLLIISSPAYACTVPHVGDIQHALLAGSILFSAILAVFFKIKSKKEGKYKRLNTIFLYLFCAFLLSLVVIGSLFHTQLGMHCPLGTRLMSDCKCGFGI